MLNMHILALDPLAFTMVALCLLFLFNVRFWTARAIPFLVLAVEKAIDGVFAARAGALRGKGAITSFADAETMDMGQASISSAVQSRAETNEMTDLGLIDWLSQESYKQSPFALRHVK
jgi:hypothetical protein